MSNADRRTLSAAAICGRLRRQHGPIDRRPSRKPLDELIATILSQNTTSTNSRAAFARLKETFSDWDAVRRARVSTIQRAIQVGGLAAQKAPRIKAILQDVRRRHGRLSLDFLCSMPDEQAEQYLRSMPGVGPKTAACVLLFACGKPVLPVDTHVHRVSRRLGLIGEKTTADQAHRALAQIVPDRLVLEFHLQLVLHGRTLCTARNPRCTECLLLDGCPEGRRRTASRH